MSRVNVKNFWVLGFLVGMTLGHSRILAQDPGAANDADLATRIEQLEREVKQLRALEQNRTAVPAEYQTLPPEEPAVPPVPDFADPPPTPPPAQSDPAPLSPLPNIFQPEPDSATYPNVRLTGLFQTDAGWFHQDSRNRETVGDVQDGWDFRRVRLAAAGDVTEDVNYLLEFDFAQSQPWFVDVWMDFQNVGNLMNVRIGRFRQPFGMTELTSVRDLPFLERPLLFALAPFRQTGIMAYGNDDDDHSHITWAASGYRFLSDNFGNVFGDNGGWGFSTRATLLPIYEDDGDRLVHLGLNYSFNDPARDEILLVNVPEFFLGQNPRIGPPGLDRLPIDLVPPFVNTGLLPTNHTNLFNLEAAGGYGEFYLQSEVRWAVVNRPDGQPTETFPGAYLHGRYILTGEKLPYDRASGLFGRIVPDHPVKFGGGGGIGAWEVAARLSWLDLNGTNLPGPGRELTNLTLGLNWYVNRYTKFQINYINANLDDPDLGKSDAHIYALRGQLDF